jgi:5-formyltetrahydrofolate cyclo-ligase
MPGRFLDQHMDKPRMRAEMKALLAAIAPEDLASRSRLAAARLLTSSWWREADEVLAFLAMPGEPDPEAVVAAGRAGGRTVAVPVIVAGEIAFRVVAGSPDGLPRDAWGIPQPDPGWPAWSPGTAASRVLMVTPGLAFDPAGHRLGRGRGYYDRFLVRLRAVPGIRATVVAFCLDEQVMDAVPHGDSDQPVDAIVTDRRVLRAP